MIKHCLCFSRVFYLVLIGVCGVLPALAEGGGKPQLWVAAAEGSSPPSNPSMYDPFADYAEFENTESEREDVHFFQHGRLLTLGFKGGWRIFTQNMAQLYRQGPMYGGYLNYFFNIEFALQFEVVLSNHNVVVNTDAGGGFRGGADFISMGVDFKYFVNRRLFSERFSWFQPFFALGAYRSISAMQAQLTNQPGSYSDKGFGVHAGVGIEFLVVRGIHFGLQYSFHYVELEKESLPLSPDGGGTQSSFQPYGDWMNINALLGINF